MTQQKQAENFIKDNLVICVSILCLTAIETLALFKGSNGVLLTFMVGAICALAGVTIERPKIFR